MRLPDHQPGYLRTPRAPTPASSRRGNVVLLVALGLTVFLGITALVVDLGYAFAIKAELQAACDAGAHAGALQLDGTDEGVDVARDTAVTYAALNSAGGSPVIVEPWPSPGEEGVEFGHWDLDRSEFTSTGDPEEINAVKVSALRSHLPTWFSLPAFGRRTLAAGAEAIAISQKEGASEVECFLPIAVASCLLEERYDTRSIALIDLALNPAGIDNVGWFRPGANPNASWLSSQFRVCQSDGTLAVGDDINLNNGVITSVLKDIADGIATSDTRWQTSSWGPLPPQASRSGVPTAKYGHTLEGPIVVFDDDSYCSGKGGKWVETKQVAGFTWAAIFDAVTTGPASGKNIRVRLEAREGYDFGTEGGGRDYGVTWTHTALVQ